MEIKEAIKWFKSRIEVMPESETKEMFNMAISALEKQDKSCNTCKHRNLSGTELPCFVCYMASDEVGDYYEPYTEEES